MRLPNSHVVAHSATTAAALLAADPRFASSASQPADLAAARTGEEVPGKDEELHFRTLLFEVVCIFMIYAPRVTNQTEACTFIYLNREEIQRTP